jgi:hypothetical protein
MVHAILGIRAPRKLAAVRVPMLAGLGQGKESRRRY